MSDDDFDDFDPMNEVDPQIRELREEIRRQAAEIVRLEATMDQIAAAAAEQAAIVAVHTAQLEMLRIEVDKLHGRYRRLSRMIWIRGGICALLGTAIGQTLAYLLF